MNCRKVRSYLSAFSESSLSSVKHDDLEAHIRNCKSCEREKLYIDEILVTAKTLPGKSLPDDFNLKLFSRIYAEQNDPTESYLPVREPSLLRRPAAWVSVAATLAVSAVVTFLFLNVSKVTLDSPALAPAYTQANDDMAAQYATSTRYKEPINTYENVIGVSGATSNYRATSMDQAKTLHLADAKVESLMVELQKRLGHEGYLPAGNFVRAADNRYYGTRMPYLRSKMASGSGLIRNASQTY